MKIFVAEVDHLNPETRAMIQAFYSRSTMSIGDRLSVLGDTENKIKEGLKKFYVSYGHESIGELANITLFFEGVSMLAAKAIQDHQLYTGQESSTRYLDFSKQPIVVPEDGNKEFYQKWGEKFRAFYLSSLEPVIQHLKTIYPDEGDKLYEKTIKVKAFDVLRGFLPAGFATNVAWTGSFRSIGTHLRLLLGHPTEEVRRLAEETYIRLKETYPNSFRDLREKDYEPNKFFYGFSESSEERFDAVEAHDLSDVDINNPILKFTDIHADFSLDFASWRDLQRHRNCHYVMPILNTRIGFDLFYLKFLPENVRKEAEELLLEFCAEISKLEDSDYNKQYAIPMGFRVNLLMKFHLKQAIYLAVLRSKKTVHATLRPWAQKLGKFIENKFNLKTDTDYDNSDWTLKRGEQDIIEKV